jgi:cystathionine beta-lyase/cystathionine gamma-synthase
VAGEATTDPGAVRLSTGLEYGEDLIADAHLGREE